MSSSEYNYNRSSDALAQAQQQQNAINSHLITEQEKILSQDLMSSVKGLETEEEQLQKSIQNQMADVRKPPQPQMTTPQQQVQQQQYVEEQNKIQPETPFQNQVEQQQEKIPNQINDIQEREKIEIFTPDQMRKSVNMQELFQGENEKYERPLFYNNFGEQGSKNDPTQPDEQETPPEQQSPPADQILNPMEQPNNNLNDESGGKPNLDITDNNNNNKINKVPFDEFEILSGTVTTLAEATDGMDGGDDVPFYHCGPAFGRVAKNAESNADRRREVLLLHGAKYSKEEWRESGILENLCRSDGDDKRGGNTAMSVTAIDIGLQWNGINLLQALRGLWSDGIISGDPLIIVTPSMSGKTILSAAEIDIKTGESNREDTLLGKMLKAWVPVASGSALKVREETLRLFEMDRIPILAINGKDDTNGKKTGKRMEKLAGAMMLEIAGGHPCYLDSPDVFVKKLIHFVNQVTQDEFSN